MEESNHEINNEYLDFNTTIKKKIYQLNNSEITPYEALKYVNFKINKIKIRNFDSINKDIANEIVNSIRIMAKASWDYHSDIRNALLLIDHSLDICKNDFTRKKIEKEKSELLEIDKNFVRSHECYFCKSLLKNQRHNLFKLIYKKLDYNSETFETEYYFSYFPIPRCSNCEKIHKYGLKARYLVFFTILSLGIIINIVYFKDYFYFGVIVSFIISSFCCKICENYLLKRRNIFNNRFKFISKYALLQKRLNTGWTFLKPLN